jgi:hypothetical protein
MDIKEFESIYYSDDVKASFEDWCVKHNRLDLFYEDTERINPNGRRLVESR